MDLRLYTGTEFNRVKDFYKKLIGQQSFSIPKKIEKQFNVQFIDAVNTEWNKNTEYYEALFHLDNIEKIARFNRNGKMLELRTNIVAEELPSEIFKTAKLYGEIMNTIHIKKENEYIFEIIIRNKKLTRILLLIDENNNLRKEVIL